MGAAKRRRDYLAAATEAQASEVHRARAAEANRHTEVRRIDQDPVVRVIAMGRQRQAPPTGRAVAKYDDCGHTLSVHFPSSPPPQRCPQCFPVSGTALVGPPRPSAGKGTGDG